MNRWRVVDSGAVRLGFATAALLPIPTGLRPPAQGCRVVEATLGYDSDMNSTARGCGKRLDASFAMLIAFTGFLAGRFYSPTQLYR